MSPVELGRVIADSIEQMAHGLQCDQLAAYSYLSRENQLRGVGCYPPDTDPPCVRDQTFETNGIDAIQRALLTGRIQTLDSGATLPEPFRSTYLSETVVAPLRLGDRTLAVLIGLITHGVVSRSAAWQEGASEVCARAALVVELERVAAAYHDEVGMRMSRRILASAILQYKPIEEIGDMILQFVCERLKIQRAGLYVRDMNGVYSTGALRNISLDYANRMMNLQRPGPVMARAVAAGQPFFARDIQNDPQYSPEVKEIFVAEKISSVLIAALHNGDSYTGALAVYPDDNRDFTPAELSVFQSFAELAAMAVAVKNLLGQQRETAVLEERNRLAREIHDTVAQSLAALVLQMETARTELDSGSVDSVRTILDSATMQARKGLEDARRAVQGMAPTSLEQQSTAEAIADLVRSFESQEGIATQFVLTGEELPLSQEQSLGLLRIAQEALNNARKYSNARRVRVGLLFSSETTLLRVEDDGVGFDPSALPAPDGESGYGLFGMRERVRLLEGEIQIESTPGWGTRIVVILPYRPTSQWRGASNSQRTEPPAPPSIGAIDGRVSTGDDEEKLRILVVDDHAIIRQGVRSTLENTGQVVVVGEARDGAEAVAQALRLRPDVVLMDLQMPGVGGLEGLRKMRVAMPDLPVVILTTFQSHEAVSEALTAGARGFMLKDAEPAQLLAAIRAARRGEVLLDHEVRSALSEYAVSASTKPDLEPLNEREQEVLTLLIRGARNREIADQLFIVPRTVEYHLANIYSKLGVSNRTEAVRVALDRGLAEPQSRPGR